MGGPRVVSAVEKRWHCENCNKVLAERRGVGTVITCRACGTVNEA